MSRAARIASAWGLNPCLPSPPGGQVRTAPDAPPPASGAEVTFCQGRAEVARLAHNQEVAGSNPVPATNPVAKASEDNGRIDAATGSPMAGEASRGCDVADLQRPARPGFTGDDDGRDVEATGGAASVITLSDASAFILSLIAAHEGRPAGDILAMLITGAAEAIGIHSLILRDAAHVDFANVPDFARRAANRFRSGVP